MKNNLTINENGIQMLSAIDDGTNALIINGTEISSSSWVGSGNYTFTEFGTTYTIKKAESTIGNYQLIQDTATTLHFQKPMSKEQELLNLLYPVGSYYDTSDSSFDPNVSFVGTWEKLTDGRVLIASGNGHTPGQTGGSEDAVVVAHSHGPGDAGFRFLHAHGSISTGDMASQSGTGRHYPYQGDRSDGSYYGTTATTASAGDSGTGKNMQPYLTVNRWHRTA